MRPKWLLLMLPTLIGIVAVLLYALGTPSSATFARAFSAGQWKASAMPGDLRCALIADLQHRGGPVGRVVVDLLERLHETRAQWSGIAKASPLCPSADLRNMRDRSKTRVTAASVSDLPNRAPPLNPLP